MSIDEACTRVSEELAKRFKAGSFSVGNAETKIVVYEHDIGKFYRALFRSIVGSSYAGFEIEYRTAGQMRPA